MYYTACPADPTLTFHVMGFVWIMPKITPCSTITGDQLEQWDDMCFKSEIYMSEFLAAMLCVFWLDTL